MEKLFRVKSRRVDSGFEGAVVSVLKSLCSMELP
jgi:hypothetical protein